MASINPVIAIYLSAIALVAFRLGWHMAFRLDRFDWQYARRDVWFILFVASLLWPLLLLRPKVLLNPGYLFQFSFSQAAMERDEARFWSNPPPCGKSILYRPISVMLSGGEGEFTFQSANVEAVILEKLREHPHLAKNQVGSVLKWLQQRDDSIDSPTAIPDQWWEFHGIADDLLRSGHGEIRCITCNQQVQNNILQKSDISGQPGWNFNQLNCPRGHTLLRVETMHIFVGSRSAVKPVCDSNI